MHYFKHTIFECNVWTCVKAEKEQEIFLATDFIKVY